MADYLQNWCIIYFEVICCKIFFETFGAKRRKLSIAAEYGACAGLAFITSLLVALLGDYLLWKTIAIICLWVTAMYFYIEIQIWQAIAMDVLFHGILMAMDYVSYAVINTFCINDNTQIQYSEAMGMLVVSLGKVILFFCILVIKKLFGKKKEEMLKGSEWFRFLIFPTFSIATITAMIHAFHTIESKEQANVLFLTAFGLVGMNIVVFYFLNDVMERKVQSYEMKLFESQVKNQTEMYKKISENYDNKKRSVHEFNNKLMCIEALVKKKQYDELEQYMNTVSGTMIKENDAIDTNHKIVNAILNTKYHEAVNKNILFVVRVNDLSGLEMAEEDVVTILSNLLNNAIEACEQCKDRRIIKIKFEIEDDMVIISVKNTYNQPVVRKNGEIKTTKTVMPENHGIGIKNIIRVIEKYKGDYVIKDEDNQFYFAIILPVKTAQSV